LFNFKRKKIDENETNASFPSEDLQRLDEMLNRTRWIVPVLPKSELECLLDAAIRLCRLKVDTKSEECQRFFREGLTISFVRVMTDDAVNTWKYDIYVSFTLPLSKYIQFRVFFFLKF
jgi:ubiquitin carboxyl-terminal hydrolase 9/24